MANFEIAFKRTAIFEGGYVNDPADKGGETYNGISRKANPNWLGWRIVDEMKKQANFPGNLKTRKNDLHILEKNLYKVNYWDAVWGDQIRNQEVANDLYDSAVNMGPATSIKLSQRLFQMQETGRMSTELLTNLNKVK